MVTINTSRIAGVHLVSNGQDPVQRAGKRYLAPWNLVVTSAFLRSNLRPGV